MVGKFTDQALHSASASGDDSDTVQGHSVLQMACHDEGGNVVGFAVGAGGQQGQDFTGLTVCRRSASLQPHSGCADFLGDTGHQSANCRSVSMDALENLRGERPHASQPTETLRFASAESVAGNIGFSSHGEPNTEILESAKEFKRCLGHVMDVIDTDVHQGLKARGQARLQDDDGAPNNL